MSIASLRKAIAQFALAHLLEGWAAPETDLLREAGLLPDDPPPNDRDWRSYCLPLSLSSYEVAQRALCHAAPLLPEEWEEQEQEIGAEWIVAQARIETNHEPVAGRPAVGRPLVLRD